MKFYNSLNCMATLIIIQARVWQNQRSIDSAVNSALLREAELWGTVAGQRPIGQFQMSASIMQYL